MLVLVAELKTDDYAFGRDLLAWFNALPGESLGRVTAIKRLADVLGELHLDPPLRVHPEYRLRYEGGFGLRRFASDEYILTVHWQYGGFMDGGQITGRWAAGKTTIDLATAKRIALELWKEHVLVRQMLDPKSVRNRQYTTYSLLSINDIDVEMARAALLRAAGLDDDSVSFRRSRALAIASLDDESIEIARVDAVSAFAESIKNCGDLLPLKPSEVDKKT